METDKITRFEIIDHTPCEECEGTGRVLVPDPSHREEAEERDCVGCGGSGIPGRKVIAWDEDLRFDVELQDDGRTLKVFIHERYE